MRSWQGFSLISAFILPPQFQFRLALINLLLLGICCLMEVADWRNYIVLYLCDINIILAL